MLFLGANLKLVFRNRLLMKIINKKVIAIILAFDLRFGACPEIKFNL